MRTAAAHRARTIAATAGATACLLASSPAVAQDDADPGAGAQTWSVQPAGAEGADGRASFDYRLPAGASVTDHAQINNFSQRPLTLRVYSQDAVNTPGGGYTLLAGDQPPADVGAWIGLDQQVTIPAEESTVIPFTLDIPDKATPGDHPGGIVASLTTRATDEEGNPVLVDHRVGARVHLRVNGELSPALEVTDLRASYHRPLLPFATGRVAVTYRLRNTGNTRLQGGRALTVTGLFGTVTRTIELGPLPEILPGQSITAAAEVPDVLPLLRLATDLSIEPAPPPELGEDPPPRAVSAGTATWAVPWSELGLVVIVGLAVWAALWQRRRRARRNAAMLADAVSKAREEGRKEAAADAGTSTD